MSSKEIAFYKRTLLENYNSLFGISGNEKLDDRGSITERMRLLYTILMDEQQLNILLGYDTNSSLYYLLDERKIDEILSKAKENTDKIKLLEGIVSKANGLISSIRKEERIKDSQKELIKKQKDIEDKKLKILKYINDNNYKGEGVIVLKENEYIILASNESIEYSHGEGGDFKTIYYILYKPDKLYTATTEEVNNKVVEKISLLESSNLSYNFSGIYDNLYKKIEGLSLSSGGKSHHTPTYKSTGDKVFLFIDNKKLHRSIYVKGKAKYCKINNEFILLSKLKNKIID